MPSKDHNTELSDRLTEEMLKEKGFGAVSSPWPMTISKNHPAIKELTAKDKGNKLPGKAARVRRTRRDKKKI